jgi:hypothetical protein
MMLRVYLFIVAFDFVVVARLLVWFSRNQMVKLAKQFNHSTRPILRDVGHHDDLLLTHFPCNLC